MMVKTATMATAAVMILIIERERERIMASDVSSAVQRSMMG
jgi:hypothetical protein